MTDARLPAEWLTDPRFDALSDRAFRTFCGSLMWSNEQGTDGALPRTSLRFFHPLGVDSATLGELIGLGFWSPGEGDALLVVDWVGMGQELAEVIQWRKAQARERQRKARQAKTKGDHSKALRSEVVTSDVTESVTRDVGQERTETVTADRDRDRRQDSVDGAKVTSWDSVRPGEGRAAS